MDQTGMAPLPGPAPPPATGHASPFVGLRPFGVGDQSRFFGRDREIVALTRAIRSHAFTAVICASGSGKSSLVRAGVLPEPGRAGWQFLITRRLETRRYRFNAALRASASGLSEMVRPLAPGAAGLVLALVINQFEELFRHDDEARDWMFDPTA